MISTNKSERIRTNHPISEDDWAVRLWDNHSLLEPEYADLQEMFLKMRAFMNLSTDQEVDFSAVENRLDISFPRELKQVYQAIQNQEEYFTGTEHFLPLDEIYVEQGILVFFKKKRTPIAGYDIENGCLAEYYKKDWHIEGGGICCYQFCVGRMLTIAIENKPVFKKGRCKGKFVTTLNIERELENFCNENYHLLSEFHVYGIAVMYSDNGLIAWIRSNGFYADIHAGAMDEAQLEALAEHLGAMEWK
ncbi:hypothetical protein LK537_12790 [Lachnoclostridium pacaense]|uniref:hypothetical protein n=1 Tax=Enterocloster hominis (ex Hitch et al. 2024) TaxID=1917870 RepID=UPI001D0FFD2D|nr:hypothetical protein [Lachnoclostridium pacaense]MCC2818173.1 hypothetical protein [Lachnoclostridium pacaense]